MQLNYLYFIYTCKIYVHNILLTCIVLLSVPNGKPVIGPVPGLSNVYLAAGHEGSGLLMVSSGFSDTSNLHYKKK